jgi:hypothetical protein
MSYDATGPKLGSILPVLHGAMPDQSRVVNNRLKACLHKP